MPHDALLPHQATSASAFRQHSAPSGGPICTDLPAGRTVAMAAVLSFSLFRSADSVRANGRLVVNRRPPRSVGSVLRRKVKVMSGQRRPFHPTVRGCQARAAPRRYRAEQRRRSRPARVAGSGPGWPCVAPADALTARAQ